MEYKIYSHRYGHEIVTNNKKIEPIFNSFCNALKEITEQNIINLYQERKIKGNKDTSLSKVINALIKDKLTNLGWEKESYIFKNKAINKSTSDWRLDFVYPDIFSVEVAFNHASAMTVNLIKPVLASELNHVEKAYQTKFGIIVSVTNEMKIKGGFDKAIGTFEGFCAHTIPLMNQLTIPLIIIGIEAPKTFEIVHKKESKRKIGNILIYKTGEII